MRNLFICGGLLFISLNFYSSLFAKNTRRDSLLEAFDKSTNQEERIELMLELSREFLGLDNDKALGYAKEAYIQSNAKKLKEVLADALVQMGNAYYYKAQYDKAISYYLQAIYEFENSNNVESIGNIYNNIGVVYYEWGNYSKALEYYKKALEDLKSKNFSEGVSRAYNNIANLFFQNRQYDSAIYYYHASLESKKLNNDSSGMALVISNIANTYSEKGDFKKASRFYLEAISIYNQIEELHDKALCLINYANLYRRIAKPDSTLYYLNQALEICNKIDADDLKLEALISYSDFYEELGNYKKAIEYYKLYNELRDKIKSKDTENTIEELNLKYETDKKEKQIIFQKTLLEKEKLTRYGLIILTSVFAVLIFFIYKAYQNKKRNALIIEQKNKEILDSIIYAKRIQNAILPSERKWYECIPNSSILYLPKNIVAGDFYWMEYFNEVVFIAVADCTGHGVPGAMVSVIGSNALTKAILEEKLTNTDQILNRVREIIIEKLTTQENIRDGMDICLVKINKITRHLEFSGANRPLWIVESNHPAEIIELPPDKQPIGHYENARPFTSKSIILKESQILYLFTDGFADQFGGPKNKKISIRRLKELIIQNSNLPLNLQKEKISQFFYNWKGNMEQVDDVTIVALKV